jgi:hypothetical protein
MKAILIGLAALTLAPAALRAQPAKVTPPAPKADLTAMYEDIEVMRRLLSRELLAQQRKDVPHPPLATFWNKLASDGPDDPAHKQAVNRGIAWLKTQQAEEAGFTAQALQSLIASEADLADVHSSRNLYRNIATNRVGVTPFEGAYLKGHGVAYTATISASEAVVLNTPQKSLALLGWCSRCHDQAAVKPLVEPTAEPAPGSKSDWDRVQKEVRGGPPESKAPPRVRVQDICAPGNLTEILLKVLAENGHNFRLLPAGEHITVAITVAGVRPSGGTPSGAAAQFGAVEALTRDVRELTDLADLHLKQGKNDAALVPLSKAISRFEETTLEFPPGAAQAEANRQIEDLNRTLRGLYVRYAQALLSAGKLVQARGALDRADQARVRVKVTTGAAPVPSPVVPNSPAKLIISVPKQAMDDVHAGKIDMTKFRALAEVETINFPPPDKKK